MRDHIWTWSVYGKGLKSKKSNKSSGNDGFSKEFYEWMRLGWNQKSSLASIHRAFLNQEITFLKNTPQLKCWRKTKAKDSLKTGGNPAYR